MVISKELILHVARIARLDLTKEETDKFTKQIRDVLDVFRVLGEVDTEDVKPSFQPLEIKNVWREDRVKKWEWEPLSNAENKEDHYFKGPRAV